MQLRPLTEAQIKKQIRKNLRPRFQIECYYRNGLDLTVDQKITRLAKRRSSSGSGMDMITGLRDICFDGYVSKVKALAAARRIRKSLPDVRVMLRAFTVAR